MGMTKPEITVICDAGPVIHLDELDCLDLLSDFQQVILPQEVHQEIERHRAGALKKSGILFIPQRAGSHFDAELMTVSRTFMLDAGETEALALMRENPDALFLTDDASARLVAEQMGFKVHGTIGIIVRSIRRGHRKPGEVLYALKEIPHRSTLYIKQSLLDEIVLKIKSELDL
jgi:predicted nucleic acid-binding protein